ncbi:MAG: dihydropteroate synthase [Verrucomicrobiota bacterium]
MGIVNVTPDSFSDGGQFAGPGEAVGHALRLDAEGADILDIGGESTRPGADEVAGTEEERRVIPVLEELAAKRSPETLLSIDTLKPSVAESALNAGADILNDVSGFRDPSMLELAATAPSRPAIVLMHMQGTPRTMQSEPRYENVVDDVRAFFEERLETCVAAGIAEERICFDPGIGFGKTLEHNLELLRNLNRLRPGNRPLLVGVSRKSFIGKILSTDGIQDRDWPTVALTSHLRESGAEIFRVHDVKPNFEALRMTEAILFGVA